MNMNPAALMKILSAKNTFDKNHPKLKNYFAAVQKKGIQEGTVIQLKITNPDDEPMIANIKVQQSDLELLSELAELIK